MIPGGVSQVSEMRSFASVMALPCCVLDPYYVRRVILGFQKAADNGLLPFFLPSIYSLLMLSFYRLLMNESAPIRFVLIPLPATLYRIVVIHTIPYIQHFKISLVNPLPGWFCWRPVLTVANRKFVSLFHVVL